MAGTIRVKPHPGEIVRNFERGFRPLPPEGEDVNDNIEWRRKIERGEVILVTSEPAAKPAKK